MTQDIRYGWRLMVRRPAFTLVAVLTLGLGIGANVTIYSWVQALLLRPMPAVADRRIGSSRCQRHDADAQRPQRVVAELRRHAGAAPGERRGSASPTRWCR